MKKTIYKPNESVFPIRFNTPEEEQMRESFIKVAQEIVEGSARFNFNEDSFLAGIELELPLVNQDCSLASQEVRDAIVKQIPNSSVELAAHQLELIPKNPADLKKDLFSLEEEMQEVVGKARKIAKDLGVSWLRVGSYPLCNISEVDYTKGEPKYIKYERSPKWHMEHQRPNAEKYILTREGPLDVSSGYIVGLMSAVQITVDATSLEDAIDKVNRSFMISPLSVALASNSIYLSYLDTGYTDVRFVAWEISHDTRSEEEVASGFPTRVGLPTAYFTGIEDYFNRILSYPFVMNDPISLQHAFEVGNGIFWRDARLKFFRNGERYGKVGVEFRPVAIQPSLYEDISVMMFYVGRLLWSQINNERLLDMNLVRSNKYSAMCKGMDSMLYTFDGGKEPIKVPAKALLPQEITRAKEGLLSLGCEPWKVDHYLDRIKDRITLGSPAEVMKKLVLSKFPRNFEQMKKTLIEVFDTMGLIGS
ncbi:MAG: hypothetical protein ABIA11_04285 [Patescibacteria group bacterium]